MEALAERLECSATHVNKLEKSKRAITPEMAIKLGEVFERDPRDFGFDPYRYLSPTERAFIATLNQLPEEDRARLLLTGRAWLDRPTTWDGVERRKKVP